MASLKRRKLIRKIRRLRNTGAGQAPVTSNPQPPPPTPEPIPAVDKTPAKKKKKSLKEKILGSKE